jgi:hypothetical protein
MNRYRDARLTHRAATFAVMKVFSFAIAGVGVAFALAAAADLALELRAGFGWIALGVGIVFTLFGIGFAWLLRQFKMP